MPGPGWRLPQRLGAGDGAGRPAGKRLVREAGVMMQRLQRANDLPVAMLFRGAVDDYGWRARLSEIVLKLSRSRRRKQAMLAPRKALLAGGRLGTHALRARAFTGGVGCIELRSSP